jgi:hypothetical protein
VSEQTPFEWFFDQGGSPRMRMELMVKWSMTNGSARGEMPANETHLRFLPEDVVIRLAERFGLPITCEKYDTAKRRLEHEKTQRMRARAKVATLRREVKHLRRAYDAADEAARKALAIDKRSEDALAFVIDGLVEQRDAHEKNLEALLGLADRRHELTLDALMESERARRKAERALNAAAAETRSLRSLLESRDG